MPFEWFDHTGDIGVRIAAPTLETLFADAALALTDAVTDPAGVRPVRTERVSVSAPELDLLLLEWLSELLFRYEARGLLIASTEVTLRQERGVHALDATVRGDTLDPSRHPTRVLVKAVTYHALQVTRTADGWSATVVFDI